MKSCMVVLDSSKFVYTWGKGHYVCIWAMGARWSGDHSSERSMLQAVGLSKCCLCVVQQKQSRTFDQYWLYMVSWCLLAWDPESQNPAGNGGWLWSSPNQICKQGTRSKCISNHYQSRFSCIFWNFNHQHQQCSLSRTPRPPLHHGHLGAHCPPFVSLIGNLQFWTKFSNPFSIQIIPTLKIHPQTLVGNKILIFNKLFAVKFSSWHAFSLFLIIIFMIFSIFKKHD